MITAAAAAAAAACRCLLLRPILFSSRPRMFSPVRIALTLLPICLPALARPRPSRAMQMAVIQLQKKLVYEALPCRKQLFPLHNLSAQSWARVVVVSQVTTTNRRLSHAGETDGLVAVAP